MVEVQRRWKLLGQRYENLESHEERRLVGSMFRDQHGAFGWILRWFGQSRDEYWFDKGEFFEVVMLDDDGHWKSGNRLTEIDPADESRMREAMSIWEREERERDS